MQAPTNPGAKYSGVSRQLVGREWHSTHDPRSREAHVDADGQRRRLDQTFDVGGEQIDKPGDGSARNAINCRCVLTYEFFDSEGEMQASLSGPN